MANQQNLVEIKRCLNIIMNRKLYYIFHNSELDMYKRLILIELEMLISDEQLSNIIFLEIAINIHHILDFYVRDELELVENSIIEIELELILDELNEECEFYEKYEACYNIKEFIKMYNKI